MRAVVSTLSLCLSQLTFAQPAAPLDATEALNRALEATAKVIAVTTNPNAETTAAVSARQAQAAITLAVEALRSRPLCVPPPTIDPVTFELFVDELKRGSRADVLPPLATSSIARHLYSVDQLKRLALLLAHASSRLQLIQLAARRLVDPENAAALYSLFEATSDKRALALILAG